MLKNKQLEGRKFRRQHSIDNFIVDFYCTEEKLIIELDGEVHNSIMAKTKDNERDELNRFFDLETLDKTRIKMVPIIENPDFYSTLNKKGIPEPMDLTTASGITYIDTVLISERYLTHQSQWLPLIFHELVHIVQYEVLGVQKFMEQYVFGWADHGFSYASIPMENDAFDLAAKYESNTRHGFSVINEVRLRLTERNKK